MKPYSRLLLILATLVFAGCRGRLKVDDAIDAGMRREIDSLNGIVLRALFEGNTETILKLSVDEIRRSDSDRIRLRRLAKVMRDVPFTRMETEHQLFSNKLRPDTASKMVFREGTEQEYTFTFYQPGRATIASFGRIPVDAREFGFTTTFSRISGTWQLVNLEIGLYRMQNLNAVDWFYKTEQQLDAHDFVDAYLQQTMAVSTLRPAGRNIRYAMEPRIRAQQQELERTLSTNMRFPIATDPEREESPQILGLSIECDSACVPLFTVLTRTPISDTTRLTADCDTICKHFDQWFPGVSNRNKVVAFRLINKQPHLVKSASEYVTLYRPTIADWRY